MAEQLPTFRTYLPTGVWKNQVTVEYITHPAPKRNEADSSAHFGLLKRQPAKKEKKKGKCFTQIKMQSYSQLIVLRHGTCLIITNLNPVDVIKFMVRL